tara:strand:- start:51 stop:500 length:450 start_codon:yes stop_codon:yes gene_type:complete
MTNQISIKTKFGWITVYENKGKIFRIKFGKSKKRSKSKVLKNFKKNLLAYFMSKKTEIKAPYKTAGNKIQKKVWAELKNIRRGKTKSYGEIAKKYKISPRYVGRICSKNKLVLLIPCHRVIRTDGSMGGFTSVGGIKLKKKLLDFEKKL